MKLTILFLVALAALTAAAPPSRAEPKLIIKSKHFPEMYLMYTGSHDIVDIAAPLIQLDGKSDQQYIMEHVAVIFFVEADVKENGDKDYKGLYVYKNGETKKILENGQSVAYGKDFIAYFGAKDGIYKYNEKDNNAVKVGTVTDSVVKMALDTNRMLIYYLTEDHVLYTFDMSNDESTKIEAVKDARDIMFDLRGNMFFYNGAKKMYVFDGNNVLEINGLPSDAKKVDFIKNPFLFTEVFVIVDGTMYKVTNGGVSTKTSVEFEAQPTAFSMDYAVHQYYAYNKKIYKYSLTAFDLIGFARSQQ